MNAGEPTPRDPSRPDPASLGPVSLGPAHASPAHRASDRTGWTLFAGAALVALGWASSPAQQGGTRVPPTAPTSAITPSFATSDSNGSMIAVTGVDITGSSLLYVIDTERQQLSVYQATGGSKATSGLRWVGARRLDLDFQVDGWNDKSELGYKELRKQFSSSGVLPPGERE